MTYEEYREKAEQCLVLAGEQTSHAMITHLSSFASVWAALALAEATRGNRPIHPGSSAHVGGPR